MAVSASALNIAQYAIMSKDPLVQAITFSLIDNGSVMADVPFVNRAALVTAGVRWEGNLPTVSWAQLNAEGTTTSGTPTPFQEQAYIIRNYIDVDKFYVLDENQIVDPRAAQTAAYMKSVAYDFNFKFLNNNHITGDVNSFVGLRFRLDNPTAWGLKTAQKIDAGGAVMTQAATAAQANAFMEFLDQLLWSVDAPDGRGVVLYMNEVMLRRIHYALRLMGTSGGLTITKDQYDRVVSTYKNAQLRDIGYKADQSTRIITTTETAAGVDGSSTFTSIYAVNYGTEHLFGWQFAPLAAKDQGLLENGTIYRTLIDWAGGLYSANNRSAARLYDIKIS
jgi:hypothetical protein